MDFIRAELQLHLWTHHSLGKAGLGKAGRALVKWCLAMNLIYKLTQHVRLKQGRHPSVAAYMIPLSFLIIEDINKPPPWNKQAFLWSILWQILVPFFVVEVSTFGRVKISGRWGDAEHEVPRRFCKAAHWHACWGAKLRHTLSWHLTDLSRLTASLWSRPAS